MNRFSIRFLTTRRRHTTPTIAPKRAWLNRGAPLTRPTLTSPRRRPTPDSRFNRFKNRFQLKLLNSGPLESQPLSPTTARGLLSQVSQLLPARVATRKGKEPVKQMCLTTWTLNSRSPRENQRTRNRSRSLKEVGCAARARTITLRIATPVTVAKKSWTTMISKVCQSTSWSPNLTRQLWKMKPRACLYKAECLFPLSYPPRLWRKLIKYRILSRKLSQRPTKGSKNVAANKTD